MLPRPLSPLGIMRSCQSNCCLPYNHKPLVDVMLNRMLVQPPLCYCSSFACGFLQMRFSYRRLTTALALLYAALCLALPPLHSCVQQSHSTKKVCGLHGSLPACSNGSCAELGENEQICTIYVQYRVKMRKPALEQDDLSLFLLSKII